MKTLFPYLLVPVLGSAALVVACSSGTAPTGLLSGDQSQGTNGVTGNVGNGANDVTGTGAGVTGGMSAGSAGGGGSFKTCAGDAQSTCSQSELQAYSDCVANACAAGYTQCFGAGYKSGSFSGACSAYISCAQACACDDGACQTACTKKLDSGCSACVKQFDGCDDSCAKPKCMSTSTSSSSSSGSTTTAKTCADLQACCAALSGSDQTSCNSLVTAAKNNATACNSYYAVLASQNKCH